MDRDFEPYALTYIGLFGSLGYVHIPSRRCFKLSGANTNDRAFESQKTIPI